MIGHYPPRYIKNRLTQNTVVDYLKPTYNYIENKHN